MNQKQPKNYPDKPKKAPKQSQGYPANPPAYRPEKKKYRPKGAPKRYPPDPNEQGYYPPYKRKPDRGVNYIYKQDLIQKGFQVYSSAGARQEKDFKDLCESFPEVFNTQKRKVVIDLYDDPNEEFSMVSKSRLHDRDELRGELLHLMDNEDIPDWFLEAGTSEKAPALFDFSNTVNRTKEVNTEITRKVREGAHFDGVKGRDEEINFEELDQLLEKKFILAKVEQSIDEEDAENLEAFESDNEDAHSHSSQKQDSGNDSNQKQRRKDSGSANNSKDESVDYFFNLQNNIKKMLFNKEESVASEEDKESEESFQESLGFEPQRELKGQAPRAVEPQPATSETILPKTTPQPSQPVLDNGKATQQQQQQPSANKIASVNAFGNFPVLLPTTNDGKVLPMPPLPLPLLPPLPQLPKLPDHTGKETHKLLLPPLLLPTSGSLVSNLPLNKLELENPIIDLSKIDEYKNISPEERESRKHAFLERYGYLDPIMCQIVYEILNSKQRQNMNKFSINGFNQKSVEKYCQNKYKIFSLYMQGDIVSKVWIYKDKLGHTQGPFMSYDMDIWNGEGNYFSEDLKIALMNSPFLPLQMYLDRAQIVIDVVQNFLLKNEHNAKDQAFKPGFDGQRRNQNNNNNTRKYTFHKKSETDKEVVPPQNYRTPAELSTNFAENFPPLTEALSKMPVPPKAPSDKPANGPALTLNMRTSSTSGEPSLLDTLRSTFKDSNVQTEPRKASFQDTAIADSKTTKAPSAPQPEPPVKPPTEDKVVNDNKPVSTPAPTTNVQPADSKSAPQQKAQPKKEAAPVQPAKPVAPQNPKKASTKKPTKRGKSDLADQYNRQDDELNYVEKTDAQEKPIPVGGQNHSDLTLSIKSLLGLNLK